jgi:SAM-dependent methyltransferase
MISLSEEWAALSESTHGKDFINELYLLFKERDVNNILELGCGDGHILNGLAKRGMSGVGVDADKYLVSRAKQINKDKKIKYIQRDWREIYKLNEMFDAVMCRGNSLSAVVSWNKLVLDKGFAEARIKESIKLFYDKLKKRGLLYIDTFSEKEKNYLGHIAIKNDLVNLEGRIIYDYANKTRLVEGEGTVRGEPFKGGSISYLLTMDELKAMIQELNPARIWMPHLKYEIHYDVICAIK